MKVKIIQVPVAGNDAETVVNKALATITGTIVKVEMFTDDRIGVFYYESTDDQGGEGATGGITGGGATGGGSITGSGDNVIDGDNNVDDEI